MTEPNASKESSRVTSLKEEERDKHVRSEEGSDSDDDSEAGQDEKYLDLILTQKFLSFLREIRDEIISTL